MNVDQIGKLFIVLVAVMTILSFVGTGYSSISDTETDVDEMKKKVSTAFVATLFSGLIVESTTHIDVSGKGKMDVDNSEMATDEQFQSEASSVAPPHERTYDAKPLSPRQTIYPIHRVKPVTTAKNKKRQDSVVSPTTDDDDKDDDDDKEEL
ncbi:hypothetical protein SK128_012829 [Halocaridina rubra]|uniref:Uncharacterized protein n=1 Tax=Halocaridina rubra TaxID=373956 RepID=A0AAN8WRB8_HALRR